MHEARFLAGLTDGLAARTEPLLPAGGVGNDAPLEGQPGEWDDPPARVLVGGGAIAAPALLREIVPVVGEFEVAPDALGRLVLGLLQTMLPGRLDELQMPRMSSLVRRLRRRVAVALCCTLLTAPIAIWLLLQGVATYVSTDNQRCSGPLRVWLLGFFILEFFWFFCMPSLALLLLGWCLGALWLIPQPKRCEQLHDFVMEASILQIIQGILVLIAAIAALMARPIVTRLSQVLSQTGTDPEIVQLIDVIPDCEVPADEDCVICLSRETEEGVPWRRLTCDHKFHETCLLEWLRKARRCPVCRLDLHQQYR
eukprot:TRINITY_DN67577_c0_g1_i1.p1 TRINITY_DN67577_c0_g1~~TRINITY_DN67577_c0_g1_i1.p1  ORF type:complete len:311 (+),score=47.55 TRINITY_DN67577_c0_g1_i1:209-1141(+)